MINITSYSYVKPTSGDDIEKFSRLGARLGVFFGCSSRVGETGVTSMIFDLDLNSGRRA